MFIKKAIQLTYKRFTQWITRPTQYERIRNDIAEIRGDFKHFNDQLLKAFMEAVNDHPCKQNTRMTKIEKHNTSLEKRIERLEKLNGIKD